MATGYVLSVPLSVATTDLGVATIMAVMEAKDLQHGPVEGLITRDEETGMYGANESA